ncbi:hypothetical protein [Zoogloea sp.]|uniref:hypothetical protein n=1 Tax=Zoogloea sp. TaxID=49181 RepID=UPI0035B0C19E
MTQIIDFPVPNNRRNHDYDADIEEILASIPVKSREKLRFELIKTIDSYDGYFTQWSLSFPEACDETLKKQIYDLAHQEHDRKIRMLKDIMRLKAKVLVAAYHQSR